VKRLHTTLQRYSVITVQPLFKIVHIIYCIVRLIHSQGLARLTEGWIEQLRTHRPVSSSHQNRLRDRRTNRALHRYSMESSGLRLDTLTSSAMDLAKGLLARLGLTSGTPLLPFVPKPGEWGVGRAACCVVSRVSCFVSLPSSRSNPSSIQ
jgi:hypothetical protein